MSDYPPELMGQVEADDNIVAYLPLRAIKSGCLGSKDIPKGFIAITEKRIIAKAIFYKDKKMDMKKGDFSEFTTNVPISKVSSMTVVHTQAVAGGCLGFFNGKNQSYWIDLNIQGLKYELYVGKTPSVSEESVRSYIDLTG